MRFCDWAQVQGGHHSLPCWSGTTCGRAGPHFFHLVWPTFLVWTTFFPPYIEIWDHLRFPVGGHPAQVFTPELMRASKSFKLAVSHEVEGQLEDLLVCLGQEEQKVRATSREQCSIPH